MFNDLNNADNQNPQVVDDIFAETDKASEKNSAAKPLNSEIEAHRVGLVAGEELTSDPAQSAGDNKWFNIAIIIIIVAILVLAGYLIYSKFFKNSEVEKNTPAPVVAVVKKQATTTSPGSFVTPVNNNAASDNTPSSTAVIPVIPGVNAPSAIIATTTDATSSEPVASSSPVSLIDTDSDGLTDAEERVLNTNLNIIDTDSDGLSDYAEVKIYHTNPLIPDTDGDGYPDGAEVKAGYNPNGLGKMPGITATSSATTE